MGYGGGGVPLRFFFFPDWGQLLMQKLLTLLIAILQIQALAQERVDSLDTKRLEEVIIKGKSLFDVERLQSVKGTNMWWPGASLFGLLDINSSFKISNKVIVRLNVNNVTNKQYFTKRPSFYPGPGVWSSDGRSINITLGFAI